MGKCQILSHIPTTHTVLGYILAGKSQPHIPCYILAGKNQPHIQSYILARTERVAICQDIG